MDYIFEPTTKFTPIVNSPLRPLTDWSRNAVVLGRDKSAHEKYQDQGILSLGVICEHQPEEQPSLFGFKVLFDAEFPHIVFVCGKRGSGKSYTLGVIAEELASTDTGIGTIIIDPVGTFWSMKIKNQSEKDMEILSKWGFEPVGFDNINVLVPIGFYHDLIGIADGLFSITIGDMTAEDWCLVFDIDRFKTQGLLIGEALEKVRNGYTAKSKSDSVLVPPKRDKYLLSDIIQCIEFDLGLNSKDEGYAATTRRSLIARFKAADNWGLFSEDGTPLNQISVPNQVTVIDVSHSKLGDAKRALIVGILARKILGARMESSRLEEATALGIGAKPIETIPVTWLIIDEAHLLLPHVGKTAATEALVEYAKLGRKPGCGLVLATQRPAATNDEILSQVDTLIGHNLALEDDMAALRRRVPAMVPAEIRTSDFIRGIPVGVGIVADQKTQQRAMVIQVRPRLTHHAGKAALPSTATEDRLKTDDSEIHEIAETSEKIKAALKKHKNRFEPSISIEDLKSEEFTQDVTSIQEGNMAAEGVLLEPPAKLESKPPELKPGVTTEDWEFGNGYLLKCKSSKYAFNILKELKAQPDRNAICITREHPDKVNKKYGLDISEIWWLSTSTDEFSVTPTNVTKIAHKVNDYIKANENSIVLLDGLEYLISNNDFPKVLKLIQEIHQTIVKTNAILIIPVNPLVIDEKNVQKLEHELDEVKDIKQLLEKDEPSSDKIREPTKKDLQGMCEALGLSTEGSIAQLKQRLLKHDEKKPEGVVPKPPKPKKTAEAPAPKREQAPKSAKISTDEDAVGKVLHELEREREKVAKEKKRVETYERKLKLAEEKRKISAERKKALLEKKKLAAERRKLELKQKELEKLIKHKKKVLKARVKAREEPAVDIAAPQALQQPPAPTPVGVPKTMYTRKPARPGKGVNIIEPELTINVVKRIVEDKYLKTTLLGRKKEAVVNIEPIFLPLFKLYLKTTPSSKIFGKDKESVIYWDAVTGELVLEHKKILTRTIGMKELFGLSPSQINILNNMKSRGTSSVQDISERANLSVTDARRTITSLKKRSMIGLEEKGLRGQPSTETYSRIVELKNIPAKLPKIKVELPAINNFEISDEILKPQYKLKNIEKMLKILSPRSTLLGSEIIHYPYFKVLISSEEPRRGGTRMLVLDAISGKEDKLLAEVVRFLK